MKPKPGELVVLIEIPRGMLIDLPPEDQQAIKEVVGKPILLNEYDDTGRAELEFFCDVRRYVAVEHGTSH